MEDIAEISESTKLYRIRLYTLSQMCSSIGIDRREKKNSASEMVKESTSAFVKEYLYLYTYVIIVI